MRFLDILVVFRLILGQISFNPGENAFATQFNSLSFCHQHRLLPYCDSDMRRDQNFRFWDFFFRLSFFLCFFLFASVIDLLLGLLAVKKNLRKHGAARCSGRKFCSEFLTQLFEHFCLYLSLHSANYSDLGTIEKIFSSCKR